VSEYQTFGMGNYVYKLPGARIPERALLKFYGKVSSSMFAYLITAYSKGELSYQSDILNAFAGLADIMKNDCGIEVCYGLVSTAISNSLLWRLLTPPAPRRMGFPSWSWCGWLGRVIVQPRWEGLSVWTTKYTWIHWYLYDGNNQFTLVPQKHWQPLGTGHELGISTAQPEETDDSPLNYFSRLFKKLRPEKLTPRTDMTRLDALRGIVDPSAPAPQYLEFLRKYGFDGATTTSPSILTVKDIGIELGASLENHTLYFRTLSTTVYISPVDPRGHDGLETCGYVHLYDLLDQHIGTGEITHADVLRPLDVQRDATAEFIEPKTKKIPVHIAILSGPSPYGIDADSRDPLMIRFGAFLRFYQVMLLTPHTYQSGKPVGACGLYERVGLAEIPGPILEGMDALKWEDILLQ
jgi:hypothetical protein